jgi:hypothetical protein
MTVSRPTAPFPTRYRLDGDDRVFLAFRTDTCDGRVLLLLVEDSEDQHPFDVVSIHLDDARLHAATPSPPPQEGKPAKETERSAAPC